MIKLSRDYSGNIEMPNVNQFKHNTVYKIFYPVLLINRKLGRAEEFSKILTNKPKQKLGK